MTVDRDFTRQSFLGEKSEEIFANLRVAIVGLGGGGSHIAQQLAHLGIGHFRLIDPQEIESSNLNRLVGATDEDIRKKRPKVEIAERTIKNIRPWAQVRKSQSKWQEADQLLKDAHVIVGGVDGYQQRDFLEAAARRFCVPLIDVGMDVTKISDGHFAVAGQMIMSRPGCPCMRCLGFLTPVRLAREENNYGDAGINPQVVWTNGMLASLAVGQLVKLFTPWFPTKDEFTWLELDGNAQTVMKSRQPEFVHRAPICPHHGGSDGTGDLFFDLRKVSQATV